MKYKHIYSMTRIVFNQNSNLNLLTVRVIEVQLQNINQISLSLCPPFAIHFSAVVNDSKFCGTTHKNLYPLLENDSARLPQGHFVHCYLSSTFTKLVNKNTLVLFSVVGFLQLLLLLLSLCLSPSTPHNYLTQKCPFAALDRQFRHFFLLCPK